MPADFKDGLQIWRFLTCQCILISNVSRVRAPTLASRAGTSQTTMLQSASPPRGSGERMGIPVCISPGSHFGRWADVHMAAPVSIAAFTTKSTIPCWRDGGESTILTWFLSHRRGRKADVLVPAVSCAWLAWARNVLMSKTTISAIIKAVCSRLEQSSK